MSAPNLSPGEAASPAVQRELREQARAIFAHALHECSIAQAFRRSLHSDGRQLQIGDDSYDLAAFSRVLVVSIGKAGHTMAEALTQIVGRDLMGIIASPTAPPAELPGFRYFIGGHPLPNADSLHAGDAILNLVHGLSEQTLVLFLISGGASAIAEKPICDDISLADVVQTYKALVHSGAPIAEINTVRKHLSALKGGRLARAAAPAHQASILLSDVPENALDALASGPTMPDTTTVAECYDIVGRYSLLEQFPASVREMLGGREVQETPKADDAAFERSSYSVVLSNATAVNAAAARAKAAGFAVEIDNSCDDWDYQPAADHLLDRLRQMRRAAARVCLISGGEVTVKVGAQSGESGRNQHFALYCAEKIAGQGTTVLSAGTDGIDGNSTATGAVVDGSTVDRAHQQGLDAASALETFNSFPLLDKLGDTIMTGPTGNNVRDLRILLAC